jgi:hypothetical protein
MNVEVEEFDISTFGRGLRWPEDGIRCAAGRKGTTRLLWLREYYVVNEGTTRKPKLSMFQALQFLLGTDVPEGSVETMTEDTRRDIMGAVRSDNDVRRQSSRQGVSELTDVIASSAQHRAWHAWCRLFRAERACTASGPGRSSSGGSDLLANAGQ